MRAITRAEWGARHDNGQGPRALPVRYAILHHSVTVAPDLVPPFDDDYAAIRTLEAIGEQRFGYGISYSWLFTPAGLVFEGHSADRIGTHTAGFNLNGLGYCLVGNYEAGEPTEAQVRAVAWRLQQDHAAGWLDSPVIDFGHSAVKATSCPGKHARAAIVTINQLALGPAISLEDDMATWSEEAAARATQQGVQAALHHRYPDGRNLADNWAQQTGSQLGMQGQLDQVIEGQAAMTERLDKLIELMTPEVQP